jgi:Membrane proteins related to metalloendopeptidases
MEEKAAKAVANILIRKFLMWFLHFAGWPAIVVILIFAILFGPAVGVAGTVYNFLSGSQVDTTSDQTLKDLYDKTSKSTVDDSLLEDDPGLAMYEVPWYIFAAIDKVLNNCENPKPETYVDLLKPEVTMKDSVIKTVTTVTYSTGAQPSVAEVERHIKIVDTVNTFKGVYKQDYVPSTTTTTSTATQGDVTATTKVTVTKEVLCDIEQPSPPDYSRFYSALDSFGITIKDDQDLVWELAKNYSGIVVDLSQPVDDLMGFGDDGDGTVTMGSGAPPPPEWVPWFLASAQKYHGQTPVGEFEALLMAIAFSESSFTATRNLVSTTGALGPMQFMPTTWAYYGGMLGYDSVDIWDPEKAIMAAGLMVAHDGAANNSLSGIRSALRAYGGDNYYVDLYVGRMYFYGKYTGWTPNIAAPGSASTKGFYWPLPNNKEITCPFGPRIHPITHVASFHTGIDISASLNTPIIAPKDGVVESFVTNSKAYGYLLTIEHEGGVETLYGHILDVAPNIAVGAHVKAGQVIAYVGNRGLSTGPHLHFETHSQGSAVNPLLFVNQPK